MPTLYDKEPPANQEQANKSYGKYLGRQRVIWSKFGTQIQTPGSTSKSKKYYLSDLESFRGGLTSDFTVAIYDELDEYLGIKPVKTYNLAFVLRRTQYKELSKQQFTELVQRKHPTQANEWLVDLEQQRNLLGYLQVYGLIDGKANEMYFEVRKSLIDNQFHQVLHLQGLTIGGSNAQLLRGEHSINGELKKRKLNCWVSEKNSFKLSDAQHLPPLFAIYPLHGINPGGKHDEWSIAFGLDAFLLDSISHKLRWAIHRSDNAAIFV